MEKDMKTYIKKTLALILALLLAACCLSGCGSKGDNSVPESADTKTGSLKIVTTIFPVYDWVMNVLGDNPAGAEVIMLLDNGVDLHSFQPTVEDMMDISSCDLFIYVGGESDKWINDVLKGADNENMTTLDLLDILGDSAMVEELKEGMQGEEEDEDEEGPVYDEHIWLSLKNASALTGRIEEALEKIDPDNAEVYEANAAAYIEKINALDAEYEAVVSASSVKTLLFGDRFPFVYMTSDYGLDYFAAFLGCSAESEASFETVTFLANKVDELGLRSIMTIDGSDGKIADTVRKTTKKGDQQILTLDSMQAVTAKDLEENADYLEIMKNNLSVLTEALK
jgi:zinc transport system substrate-binding protein